MSFNQAAKPSGLNADDVPGRHLLVLDIFLVVHVHMNPWNSELFMCLVSAQIAQMMDHQSVA